MIEYQSGVQLLRQNIMSKIALCLSGQPRSIEKGYEFVKRNILDGNDVEIFCHTWECQEATFAALRYNTAIFMIEKPLTNDLSKYTRVPPPQPNWKVKDPARATYNQLYAIMKCNQMKTAHEKSTGEKFDWVIRSRYDFAINVRIPFDELDNSKLYIPNCRMTPGRDFGNDQFAFSSSENMDKYADTFNHIDEFYDSGSQMMCEDMMSLNWKMHGLVGENLVYCDLNHPFPPGPHNGTWHSLIREDFDNWQK
jgi:hypothetical protein